MVTYQLQRRQPGDLRWHPLNAKPLVWYHLLWRIADYRRAWPDDSLRAVRWDDPRAIRP